MDQWSSRFEYSEENVKRLVPKSAGVYRLIYKNSSDGYKVFYVGQSDDLERRLFEHLADSEQNACIKQRLKDYTCYLRFIKITTQSERDKIEEQQISEYKPTCNN